MQNTCPSCKNNSLSLVEFSQNVVVASGDRITVNGLIQSKCETCGYSEVNSDQITYNSNLVSAAVIQNSNGMTPDKIKRLRNKYSLTQAKASAIFGGGPRAFSKYETGEIVPAESMEKLLWLALMSGEVMRALANRAHVKVTAGVAKVNLETERFYANDLKLNSFKVLSPAKNFAAIDMFDADFIPKKIVIRSEDGKTVFTKVKL